MAAYHRLLAGIGFCCIAASPIHAQDNIPNGRVDPLATEKAPNTTALGQTKPPSRSASPTSVEAIERPTPRQAADDRIDSSVCAGCKPGPATTGAIPAGDASDGTTGKRDVVLDQLRVRAAPKEQTDLNTVELASAHRERAKSMEEKTDGLWQSWLVSVCQGCGDQRPARSMRYEEWPDRDMPFPTGAEKKASTEKARPAEAAKTTARPHGTLVTDLSPENIDSIRQRPQQ